jgi:hypothetical protein
MKTSTTHGGATMKNEQIVLLQNALINVEKAIADLTAAIDTSDNYGDKDTIKHFRHQLNEFLSCDNNEAGLSPYVDRFYCETCEEPTPKTVVLNATRLCQSCANFAKKELGW